MPRAPIPGLVWSSDDGKTCPKCNKPVAGCTCRTAGVVPAGPARMTYETKGRKGKGATVLRDVPLDPAGLKALGKELKRVCGSGGTVKDGAIEVQGDHRDAVRAHMLKKGLSVKG